MTLDKLYATTISDNFSAIKVLEKCGFIKNLEIVMLFQIFIDSDDDDTVYILGDISMRGTNEELIAFVETEREIKLWRIKCY